MWNASQSIGAMAATVLIPVLASLSHAAEKVAKAEPPVTVTVSPAKASPRLRQVNSGAFEMIVAVKNTGNGQVVLWPCLSAEVLDAKGKPVARSHNIGWGDSDGPCALDEIRFTKLPPGKAHLFKVRLDKYGHDLASTGWQLPGSGKYQVVLRYKFDRAAVKARYGRGCQAIDDPEKPWNRAVEIDRTEKVKLDVKP